MKWSADTNKGGVGCGVLVNLHENELTSLTNHID